MREDELLTQYVVLSSMSAPGVYASGYANPSEWLFEALTGHGSGESEVHVSADKALTFAPWFQGISIISGDVARVPLDVFSRSANDDRNKERNHPAYELLNRRANRYMSSFTVRETVQADALGRGNGFAAIIWQGATPVELIPLVGGSAEKVRDAEGKVVVVHTLDSGEKRFYSADDVLHIRGLGNGLMGYSVFRYARESLGLGLSAQRHGNRHFANDARPNVVLKWPAKLTPPEADELLDQWERRHRNNPSRPALAAGGLDIVPMAVSNEDSQWIESRKFSRDEVASWLSLPPHKLGSDARLSYNSVEAEERSYVSQTLMRWFTRWDQECDIKLLTGKQQSAWWYFEHNTGALIQGDFATQSTVAVNLKNAMIITRNEARRKFNLNSVPDGDVFENAATSSGSAAARSDTSAVTAVHRELIKDRVSHLVQSEIKQIVRAATGDSPLESMTSFYGSFEGRVAQALEYPIRAYRIVTELAVDASDIASLYVARSRELLDEAIDGAECANVAQAISQATATWIDTRPAEVLGWIPEPERTES